jgi:hypothetical protein
MITDKIYLLCGYRNAIVFKKLVTNVCRHSSTMVNHLKNINKRFVDIKYSVRRKC